MMDESQEVLPTRAAMSRAPRPTSIMPVQQPAICVSGETIAPRDAVFRRLDVDLLVAKKQITQTDVIVTGTFFTGSIVSSGPISGSQLNVSGPATVGSLTANTIVGNNLTIANTALINNAFINNASMHHATISDVTISTLDVVTSLTAGNGTFLGPLYLQGNPPATDSDLLLARNSSGAATQTTVPVGLLTGATSGNIPNTLVLRDILGNFTAGTITAGLIGNVTGNVHGNLFGNVTGNVSGTVTGSLIGNVTGNVSGNVLGNLTGNVVGNVSGAASANVLKIGDTMTGTLRITPSSVIAAILQGQSTTLAPALRLLGNPTAINTDMFLAIDSSGNVKQTAAAISVSLLANATSNNVVNTLVKRDSGGRFATTAITLNAGTLTSTSINQANDPNTGIYFPGADQMSLVTGGAEKLLANTVGVGIGNMSPLTQLTVGGALSDIGRAGADGRPYAVFLQGRYAYVVNNGASTLQVIDVSVANNPTSISSIGTDSEPSCVYVQGQYAYVVTLGSRSLQVIDITNPTTPVIIGSTNVGRSPQSIYVQGRYAYVVNYDDNTLEVLDISDPRNPVSVGSRGTERGPQSVYVQGRYAYVVNYDESTLQVFDVDDPTSLVALGSRSTDRGPRSVYVQGRYAYIATYDDATVQVFDVSDPTRPAGLGSLRTEDNPQSIYVQGRYVYMVGKLLLVIDVSDPARLVLVTKLELGGTSRSVFVQGRFAYAIVDTNRLTVFDLGSAYIQQLEAGGIEVGTAATRENLAVGNDLDVKGGLCVGKNLNVQGQITANTVGTTSPLRLVNIPQATTTALYIDANGYVTKDASSKRFKEHIVPLGSEADLLYTLTPVKFDFKAEHSGRKNMYGFIVEDLAGAYPSIINYDAAGLPHDYIASTLHALEIKALQQQKQQLKELLATVASLQAQVNFLQKRSV
jgi:hypothetical protein